MPWLHLYSRPAQSFGPVSSPGQRSSITNNSEMEGQLHSPGNRGGGPRVEALKTVHRMDVGRGNGGIDMPWRVQAKLPNSASRPVRRQASKPRKTEKTEKGEKTNKEEATRAGSGLILVLSVLLLFSGQVAKSAA